MVTHIRIDQSSSILHNSSDIIYQDSLYSEYRKTNIHDGLVEDKGRHLFGFQDIQILDHLCARVKDAEGKVYFVDERETMEKRVRAALAR